MSPSERHKSRGQKGRRAEAQSKIRATASLVQLAQSTSLAETQMRKDCGGAES